MLIVVLVVTVLFVLFLRTNPTGRKLFDRARTLIAVNLLISFFGIINVTDAHCNDDYFFMTPMDTSLFTATARAPNSCRV